MYIGNVPIFFFKQIQLSQMKKCNLWFEFYSYGSLRRQIMYIAYKYTGEIVLAIIIIMMTSGNSLENFTH